MHYFMYMYALGIVLCLWITPYLYGVTSDIQGCHGDAWDYVWPTCRSATSRVYSELSWRILLLTRMCIHVAIRMELHCTVDLCD